MKMTITTSYAVDLLRSDKNANWSYAAARALVKYLEELEESTGEEIEFCQVSIRYDYSEYASLQDWLWGYQGSDSLSEALNDSGIDLDGEETDEEIDELIRDFINDHGTLIEFSGGIIVSSF